MNLRHLTVAAETHLNDLQADMEAGSRHVDHIHDTSARIRDGLIQREQASLMGSLVEQLTELKACLKQQRATMRDLRQDIRSLKELANNGARRA